MACPLGGSLLLSDGFELLGLCKDVFHVADALQFGLEGVIPDQAPAILVKTADCLLQIVVFTHEPLVLNHLALQHLHLGRLLPELCQSRIESRLRCLFLLLYHLERHVFCLEVLRQDAL